MEQQKLHYVSLGVFCPSLEDPDNGNVTVPSTEFGAVATYTCINSSFYLNGPDTRECQANGNWSGDEPQCISKCFYALPFFFASISNIFIQQGSLCTGTCL